MTHDPGADSLADAEDIADGERIAHNVASIADIPWEELPDGPARFCLLDMAYVGGDVGAFRAADGHRWVHVGSRVETCAAWAARFSV